MSYRTRVFILVLLAGTIMSCKKNKKALFDGLSCTGQCYILTGKLVDQTNSPLSGTELKFFYRPPGYTLLFDPTKYLGKAVVSSDGKYYFTFDSKNYRKDIGYFRIEAAKPGYIYHNSGDMTNNTLLIFNLDSTQVNNPIVNNLKLYKSASLVFKVKASTITNFQFLTISYSYGTNGYGPALNGNRSIDTTLRYKTASDIPTYINWIASGNGVKIQKKDTVVVPSGSERIYNINL